MTYPKFIVLSALSESGPLTVSELSVRTSMDSSTLSPLLKKMAVYGVLTRDRAVEDERRVVISLTDMGRDSVQMVREAVLDALKGLDLDPAHSGDLVAMLTRAREKVETAKPARQLDRGHMPPPLGDC